MRTHKPELWKGIVAGAAAGLAAAWIMTQFQIGLNKVKKKADERSQSESQAQQSESEDATMKTASAIARKVFHTELSKEQERKFSPYVHYGFGTLMGAVYGGLAETFPAVTDTWGTRLGSALFIAVDEIAVPALGLSGSRSTRVPLSTHLYAWASHLVYGVAAESVRRPVREMMGHDDLQSRMGKAAENAYQRIHTFAQKQKQRSRERVKSGLKTAERGFETAGRTARKMRKAA